MGTKETELAVLSVFIKQCSIFYPGDYKPLAVARTVADGWQHLLVLEVGQKCCLLRWPYPTLS